MAYELRGKDRTNKNVGTDVVLREVVINGRRRPSSRGSQISNDWGITAAQSRMR